MGSFDDVGRILREGFVVATPLLALRELVTDIYRCPLL